MPSATQAALFALLAATAFLAADARQEYVAKLPNGAKVPGVKALGHTDVNGGGSENKFGRAFDSAGLTWTTAFCQADTDGDGQTNGQELGDPCCAWVKGSNAVVLWTDGVSHPGDASKMSDPTLWANVTCNTTTSSTPTTTSGVEPATISSIGLISSLLVAISIALAINAFRMRYKRPFSQKNLLKRDFRPNVVIRLRCLAQNQPVSQAFTPSTVQTSLFALLLVTFHLAADARKEYVAKLPNGAKVRGVKALGHTDPSGGGDTNEFARSFEYTGLVWSTVFCYADSDGDGQTNGQELGDPCCEWDQDSNPVVLWTDGVSHPGDTSKKSNESLWEHHVQNHLDGRDCLIWSRIN